MISFEDPRGPLKERLHTQYDKEIGWVNIPDILIKDIYGKGTYLKTNAQGFRNNEDFAISVPPGKIRIICSGDSFTLGFGVSNDQTWCQDLVSIDPHLETVNMGQGGYGVDQSYVLYVREGRKLEHQIHLFAFIDDDILDRYAASFNGYGKPYFKLENNQLVLCNVPVPKRPYYLPWITSNMWSVNNLRSVSVLRSLLANFQKRINAEHKIEFDKGIVLKIFEALDNDNRSAKSVLVAVYLPNESDFDVDHEKSRQLRSFLHEELKKRGILFIDLFDDFNRLPHDRLRQLFHGHYNIRGNKYVAGLIYKKLLELNLLSEK